MTKQIQITYPIQILPTINNPVLSRTCRKWPFISKVLDRLPSRILRKIYSDDYSVNERIIEHPFVHANLAGVSPGARILDVGSNYSPLVLELAGLGFNVTALDINESAFQHPNITFATGSICNTAFDNEAFDVVTAISTVEHIGLGYYGDSTAEASDIKAVREIRRILKASGKLILTVPYGVRSTTKFTRIYDRDLLNQLLDGFEKLSELYAIRTNSRCWMRSSEEEASIRKVEGFEHIRAVVCLALKKV